ncbi:MAG: tetratricopeptide repeat protein [Acidobacteria bacterium]|nr:tetratricopeptide repeat protein [Acidobacteriota bacterium]
MINSKAIIFLIFVSFLLAGCTGQSAKNNNANVVENFNKATNANVPGENSNSEINSAADRDVPKFSDAAEALKKADEYLDANKTRMAIDAYKQAAELDPDLAEAHFKLGIAYSLQESEAEAEVPGGDETAEKSGKRGKKAKPEKKNSEKAFENAVKAYKKLIAKNPKKFEYHFDLGRAYNKLFDDVEAEKALRKAVDLNPDDSLYRTELGAVLIKLAKYPAAIKELDEAIELDEDNFRAEDLLVEAREGKKRTDFKTKTKDGTP